ncbi:hypothetical protein [Nitrosomonas sp.]|uniref:hypothetical protein n=1 Tax=Nitrosomonas sp. TaxID=42353 RepID=UPI0025D2EAF7|nr:hypothetical protein [Nitrosomonas sp.]MBY0485445.1 hypothetical protein [Nitrosomonas sp.]
MPAFSTWGQAEPDTIVAKVRHVHVTVRGTREPAMLCQEPPRSTRAEYPGQG